MAQLITTRRMHLETLANFFSEELYMDKEATYLRSLSLDTMVVDGWIDTAYVERFCSFVIGQQGLWKEVQSGVPTIFPDTRYASLKK